MRLPDLTAAARGDLLERARERCFFLDLDDAAARLCRANMPFGIAKIHWMQSHLGFEPDATFVSSPDSTVTRNPERWRSGLGYGGVIEWTGELVPAELKPNCCGMLLCGLREVPARGRLLERVGSLARSPLDLDPVPAVWDLDKGNHFLSLYEVSEPAVVGGHPYAAILHCSGRELRAPNRLGPGLYPGDAGTRGSLASLADAVPTPFGPGLALSGDRVEMFFDYVEMVDAYARRRREAYARELFGADVEVLFNESHQTLERPGRMRLGCYDAARGRPPWVPVTLRAELPAYLIEPAEVYSEAALLREGALERARRSGCLSRVREAGILPHGGGYAFPRAGVGEVEVEDGGPEGARRFRFPGTTGWSELPPEELAYRGEEVIDRLRELGCGRPVATLRPLGQIAP